MTTYTVVWPDYLDQKLAQMWLDNPAIAQEIADAVDEIERNLKRGPNSVGSPAHAGAGKRFVVRPPITILFETSEADRLVRVVSLKFWDE
jgi:hypothetical protein